MLKRILICFGIVISGSAVALSLDPDFKPEEHFSALLGTQSTAATPVYRDARLYGCSVEFNVLARDWIYKQGGFIRVNGSFAFLKDQGKVGVTLKVVLSDLDLPRLQFNYSAPTSAHFVTGAASTRDTLITSGPSDAPGALFSIFQLEPAALMIINGLAAGKVTLAISRTKGGTDILLPIETDVVDTDQNGRRQRGWTTVAGFKECVDALLR